MAGEHYGRRRQAQLLQPRENRGRVFFNVLEIDVGIKGTNLGNVIFATSAFAESDRVDSEINGAPRHVITIRKNFDFVRHARDYVALRVRLPVIAERADINRVLRGGPENFREKIGAV